MSLVLSLVLMFSTVKPAKAFYLEVPEFFKVAVKYLKSKSAIAQEGGTVAPAPSSDPTFQPSQPPPPPSDQPPAMPPPVQPPQDGGTSNDQQFQDLRQGAQQMDTNLRKFDSMMKDSERSGREINPNVRDNFNQARDMVNKSKSAQGPQDLEGVDVEKLDRSMESLDESRQEIAQQEQRLKSMRRNLSGMERGVTMFEKQVARLAKQGITVPENASAAIQKIKDAITKIKETEDADEADEVMQELPELMDALNESRQELEMLSRWPQTLKQLDRELKRFTQELKRSKTIVDRLAKKEIDLSQTYTMFEEAVNKLKAVRDEAVEKVKSGNGQEAFELIENDFFGQMQDVWEHQRVIQMMSNLGRFTSEFKRGVSDAERTISSLKRKKIATSDLESILAEVKTKGEEVKALLKTSPVDEEAVMSLLQELEDLRQQFEDRRSELTGDEEARPWEGGKQNFKAVELPSGLNQFIKKEPTSELIQ
ncbi:MAG: hypothetical protein A2751_00025 [Candidatus Doudnabacteria bacterium RIFCSPHIGHO2_01_FULL_46_14]|uniref:Uncharacterized protein n=1 Tax=Candidatus Doudnabacteria bacterium RIFCSPHIGHO2_01_FULL_46_14 TaxID=1817824 RepID=A0A1F5NNH0_9BACT|nr:MAG: hypothetical protein A2751_00025 [Candidatus Doudnabacteria bacterium RIFCSPHIGHO2_01_FULL_46_14]